VATLARAAIVNYINGLPPGSGFVYADAETALARRAGIGLVRQRDHQSGR